MLVAGAVSFPQMRAQFFPDVIIDRVTVSVRWDGAGPEDVDRAIVQVVEPALLGIEGVKQHLCHLLGRLCADYHGI
jgi:multidrug efflux pump subunit AcrB